MSIKEDEKARNLQKEVNDENMDLIEPENDQEVGPEKVEEDVEMKNEDIA
jgi:hypothetical protein